MTRLPKENDEMQRKGAWDAEEDEKLRRYVETYGTGHWRSVGKKAGLQRCGKSCRLRWTNYLRPDIRHGSFTLEEEDLIIKLHAAHGSRWSLIAAQMPGRTDNDIKNHWNTRLKKKLCDMGIDPVTHKPIAELLRDLAGSMAQSSGSGRSQALAEEAARRYFRDSLVNKAVQDFGNLLNPAQLVSGLQEASSSLNFDVHRQSDSELVSSQDMMNLRRDIAQRYSPGTSGYNSHSVDNSYSTSTDDGADLSSRSVSPPFSAALENPNQTISYHAEYQSQSNHQAGASSGSQSGRHGQNLQHNYQTHHQASSSGHNVHTAGDVVAHLSTNFQELSGPGSFNQFGVALRPSSRPVQPIRKDLTCWLSSRSSEEELPQQLSRFGSELQNFNQLAGGSDDQSSHDVSENLVVSNYNVTQEGGDSNVDIRMNLVSFNAGTSNLQQEIHHFGSTSSTFTGALISPTSSGISLMDIAATTQQSPAYAPTIFPFSSGALISPQNAHLPSVFHSPSIDMAGAPITEMRLRDQFEVPCPRMELWDFQE